MDRNHTISDYHDGTLNVDRIKHTSPLRKCKVCENTFKVPYIKQGGVMRVSKRETCSKECATIAKQKRALWITERY